MARPPLDETAVSETKEQDLMTAAHSIAPETPLAIDSVPVPEQCFMISAIKF
jgi:hypothetical protein